MKSRWNDTRKISQRWIVSGTLELLTPARFGAARASQTTDMPILRDSASGRPLLPGSSIAGALRAYLNERLQGYESGESDLARLLFGQVTTDKVSYESYLTVEDALASQHKTEFRPGVSIDPATRTVKQDENRRGQLFDAELLQPGTMFDLRFELDLPEDEKIQEKLKMALSIALNGFEKGEIGLGARKRRGFGECQVKKWTVESYDLRDKQQLLNWIEGLPGTPQEAGIAAKLQTEALADQRRRFTLQAWFELETSLLIRSSSTDPKAPDMSHLRNGRGQPVLSGTSLAGALRARALRIANSQKSGDAVKQLICEMFGPAEIKPQRDRQDDEKPFASRMVVRERVVGGRNDLVQSRIRIDRFTGGAFPGALFDQQPLIGGEHSEVHVEIELRNPTREHIGLLLNLLKDLWTGDLPLGGEASVGRGRLKGRKADLAYYNNPEKPAKPKETWVINRVGNHEIRIDGDQAALEKFVSPSNSTETFGGAQ